MIQKQGKLFRPTWVDPSKVQLESHYRLGFSEWNNVVPFHARLINLIICGRSEGSLSSILGLEQFSSSIKGQILKKQFRTKLTKKKKQSRPCKSTLNELNSVHHLALEIRSPHEKGGKMGRKECDQES